MTTILEQLSENPILNLHRSVDHTSIKDELEKYLISYWLEPEQIVHINKYVKYAKEDRDYVIFTCIKTRSWVTKELGDNTEIKIKIHEYVTLTTDNNVTNFIIYEILDPNVEIRLSFAHDGLSYVYKYFKTKITNTFQYEIDKLIKKKELQDYSRLKGLEITIGIIEVGNSDKAKRYNYIKDLL